jgi:hypothetical protein
MFIVHKGPMAYIKTILTALLISSPVFISSFAHAAGEEPPAQSKNAKTELSLEERRAQEIATLIQATALTVAQEMGITLTPERIGTLIEQIIENIELLPEEPSWQNNPQDIRHALLQITPNTEIVLQRNNNTLPAGRPLWTPVQRANIQNMLTPMVRDELTDKTPGKMPLHLDLNTECLNSIDSIFENRNDIKSESDLPIITHLFEGIQELYFQEVELANGQERAIRNFMFRVGLAIRAIGDLLNEARVRQAIINALGVTIEAHNEFIDFNDPGKLFNNSILFATDVIGAFINQKLGVNGPLDWQNLTDYHMKQLSNSQRSIIFPYHFYRSDLKKYFHSFLIDWIAVNTDLDLRSVLPEKMHFVNSPEQLMIEYANEGLILALINIGFFQESLELYLELEKNSDDDGVKEWARERIAQWHQEQSQENEIPQDQDDVTQEEIDQIENLVNHTADPEIILANEVDTNQNDNGEDKKEEEEEDLNHANDATLQEIANDPNDDRNVTAAQILEARQNNQGTHQTLHFDINNNGANYDSGRKNWIFPCYLS